jgi:polysaccharide deacetylase 2 family uncharacterized protein YibQ
MSSKRSRSKPPARKPATGGSRPPKKGGKRSGSGIDWRVHLILAGAAVVLVTLVWLAQRAERQPPAVAEKPAAVQVDQSVVAREQAEAFLAVTGVPAGAITREPPDLPRVYQIRHRLPAAESVKQLRQRLRQLSPPLVLSTPEDGVLSFVDGQGRTLLTIQYLPIPLPPPKAAVTTPGKVGRVAIIVDDLGRGTHQAKQLLAIKQAITLSILPGEPHAAEVARMAHAAGHEVMLHAPMEPQGFPVVDPGDDALLTRLPDGELRSQLLALLDRVPYADGVNNHMGSRFTEDERAMGVVMSVLHERGLFFVDSLTSSHSVGTAMANRAGVQSLRRDVFLDNVAEVDLIVKEIRRLAGKARNNGGAVGICHPYPETLQALRLELPRLASQGVEFVKVSELLKGGG